MTSEKQREEDREKQLVEDNKILVKVAYDVFQNYYSNCVCFEAQCDKISCLETKNKFLRLAVLYKVLVKDGYYRLPAPIHNITDNAKCFDVAYKFIALCSIIEAITSFKHQDFYQWIGQNEKLPICSKKELKLLYDQYKVEYGARNNFVSFFEEHLTQEEKEYLQSRVTIYQENGKKIPPKTDTTIRDIAKLFYDIRSEFVHEARLTANFCNIYREDRKGKKNYINNLKLNKFMRLFEKAFLRYYSLQWDKDIDYGNN